MPVTLPCGQCVGCRLEKSRQWAVRCVHEAAEHENNCFITLTFSDANLDPHGTLVKEDFQKFMKRLRKFYDPQNIRYFHCGEYGELLNRPHHHAILFGLDFRDKVTLSERDGITLYQSDELDRIWGLGHCSIGEVNFETCAYVARYVMKKRTGKDADYGDLVPPYNTMSRRPGIGANWFAEFKKDVYPSDEVVIRKDIVCKPPKFYDRLYDLTDPVEYKQVRRERLRAAAARADDNTLDRLAVKEQLKLFQVEKLERNLS